MGVRRFAGLVGVVAVVLLVASGCVLQGSWTALTPADPPAPPPGVTADPDFSDVSCPIEDWCLAVGAAVGDDPGEWAPLAEVWDGSTWTVVDTSELVSPDGGGVDRGDRIDHVSCRSAADCVVVVEEYFHFDGAADTYHLIFTWDGVSWTEESVGFFDDELAKDVDCAVGGVCILWEPWGVEYATWDGSSWSAVGSTGAEGPAACHGSSFCVRIGQWGGFADHWDGSSWTSNPVPEANFVASSVDCTSPARCVAVGVVNDGLSEVGELVSANWDGSAWTMHEAPVAEEGSLDSVSCVGVECVALGVTTGGDRVTVAYTADKWRVLDATPGGASTVYEDLSCAGLSCLAVGWSGPVATSSLAAAEYAWTNQPAQGIVVNTPLDGSDADPGDGVCEMTPGAGDCSLRAAVDESNADPAEDLVTIAPGVDPVLTVMGSDDANAVGDLDVHDDLTVRGQGSTVDGNGADRVLHTHPDEDFFAGASLRLVDVTVMGAAGDGIYAQGDLYLDRSAVSDNGGHGILAESFDIGSGDVVLTRSEISGNGVGLETSDAHDVLLVDTVISDNGGLAVETWATWESVRVIGSTITGNGSGFLAMQTFGVVEFHASEVEGIGISGSGVQVSHSLVIGTVSIGDVGLGTPPHPSSITNSTIVGDDSDYAVVASADAPDGASLEIVDSTISGAYPEDPNTPGESGGVMAFAWFDVQIRGSVFVGESTAVCGPGFEGPYEITSLGHNIANDSSCGFDQPSDLEDTDPLLGPLADNGGRTWTRLPGPGSPAIDAVLIGTAGLCDGTIPTDQRGVARPQGPACDIGAVEQ